MHITTHALIDREKPVGELIDENVDLSIDLQKHYANPYGSFPDYGQFAIPANRDTWRPFSLTDVYALEGIGRLLETVDMRRLTPSHDRRWVPGIFVVKLEAEASRDDVAPVHLKDSGPGTLDSILECGVGQIYMHGYRGRVLAATSLVLRKTVSGDEEQLSVRTYAKRAPDWQEELIFTRPLLDEGVGKDLLQLQRNAMWNTTSEPS